MASVTSYLLVSNVEDEDAVCNHSIIAENDFELRKRSDEEEEEAISFLKFAAMDSLEEKPDLERPARSLSSDFPDATVIYCEVEERFDQIEHFRTTVFINGRRAGDMEHGYVLNVGS